MIISYSYTLEHRKNGIWYMENLNPLLCTKCKAGMLQYRDQCPRICRELEGEKDIYMIPRGKCTNCGTLHRILPDFMQAYKQYSVSSVRAVIDGVITTEDALDRPCEMTIMRWLRNQ